MLSVFAGLPLAHTLQLIDLEEGSSCSVLDIIRTELIVFLRELGKLGKYKAAFVIFCNCFHEITDLFFFLIDSY